ncbi:hypothetical protein ADL19_14960 [Streptomyces purpurogeneiscleroticus]|nr:hypothetical protein ADL19_14960 [Streptomyces purpurogeneiscleroticus]
MSLSKTSEGLIKAAVNLSPQAQAAKRAKRLEDRPKFTYEPGPHATHGTKYLSEARRNEINNLLASYKEAERPEEKREILGLLKQHPIQLVPTKIETRVDYAKNTGERMRWVSRNSGGPKEKARAERRLKAMREGVGHGAMDGRRPGGGVGVEPALAA